MRSLSQRSFLSALVLIPVAAIHFAGACTARATENSYDRLAAALDRKIGEMDWGGGTVSLYIADLEHDIPVTRRNPDQPMNPGAVTMIFTAAAALNTFGPDHTFNTGLFMTGKIKKQWFGRRTLEGDLIIQGWGDPTMTDSIPGSTAGLYTAMDKWADILATEKKITRLKGEILVDDSAFDDERFAPGWPIERLGDPDLPEVSALNLNDNCVDITWTGARRANSTAVFETKPKLRREFKISGNVRANNLRTSERTYTRQVGSGVISASGFVPQEGQGTDRTTFHNPAMIFGEAFRGRLEDGVIHADVPVRRTVINPPPKKPEDDDPDGETAPPPVVPLDSIPELINLHASPPLSRIADDMIRHRRVLDAEVLFKSLGRNRSGGTGTFENGREAVTEFIRSLRFDNSAMILFDGSGMSRLNRASANNIMSFFRLLRLTPSGRTLFDAMPRSGQSGTLRDRFGPEDGPLGHRERVAVHAVGSPTEGGYSMAGIAMTRGGFPLHFVIMVSGSSLTGDELEIPVDAVIRQIGDSDLR